MSGSWSAAGVPEKLVYLMRHAKSSRDDPQLDDHERPLNPRGLKAARRVAEHMRRNQIAPALVLCSSARRARDTMAPLQQVLGPGSKIKVEDGLYAVDAAQLLKRLRRVSDSVPSVMIIGHNPSIQDLAVQLIGDRDTSQELTSKFPTAALATLSVGRPHWRELSAGDAELVAFLTPKNA
jgi:phosphohistidine phosphatase